MQALWSANISSFPPQGRSVFTACSKLHRSSCSVTLSEVIKQRGVCVCVWKTDNLSCVPWPPACEGEAHINVLNCSLNIPEMSPATVCTRQRQIMQMAITTAVQILVKHVLISLNSGKVPSFSLSGSPAPAGLGAASACEDICWFLSLFPRCVWSRALPWC